MISAKACSLASLVVVVFGCQGSSAQPTATAEPRPSGSAGGSAAPSGKGAECSALIGVVNGGLADLEAEQAKAKQDPSPSAELRAMVTAMDKAALAASKLGLATPELLAFATRYQTMCKAVATHATTLADAANKKDLAKVQQARSELTETLKLEDPLIDEVNKFCQ